MSDLIGKTLGPYRLLEQIGVGGMATVYKAYQPSMDRDVAIKILPHYLSQDEQFAKRFEREAHSIAKLEHPHILPVYDYGAHDGTTYIAMRYVRAGTLKERIARGPLPLDEVVRLIGEIGGALDYAHRQGIIHRDVKPGNVLIDAEGHTYLTDFGLAHMLEASQQLTASGVGVGTPAYMSPEQGQGVKVDQRSDIYSLGIILYEMVTGHVPFEAETPMAVVLKHITEPLPLPRTVMPTVPEAVQKVILKALAKDPAHRFQTAEEMVAALAAAHKTSAPEPARLAAVDDAPSVTRVALGPQPKRSRGQWAIVGGLILIGLIGVIGLGVLVTQWASRAPTATPVMTAAPTTALAMAATAGSAPTATKVRPPTVPATPAAKPTPPASSAAPAALCRVAWTEKTGDNTADIFVQGCDGSNWRRLTKGRVSGGHEPAWSPDGQRLVFDVEGVGGDMAPGLYIITADGSKLTQIISPDGPVGGAFPAWSPDGSRIAIASGCDIFTVHPDGSGKDTLLAHRNLSGAGDAEMCAHRPMWSPDSQRIAFATFPIAPLQDPSIPGPYEFRFYVVNADGTGLTKLASFKLAYAKLEGGASAMEVAWLPNGKQLAFEVREGDKTRRYQMNADGSGEIPEIKAISDAWYPWHWPQWGGQTSAAATNPPVEQARVFAKPILQAIANRRADVEDDFSAADKSWVCGSNSLGMTLECQAVDGVARLTPAQGGFLDLSHPWMTAGSFVLMLDAREVSGSCASSFQFFVMGLDRWNNLHLNSCMNEASVHVGYGGQSHTELEGGGGSVRPIGKVNHIQIVARGPRFAFYVNDTLVHYVEESHLDAVHQLGFRCNALPEMVCEFDNVKFWDLDNVPGLP